MTADIKRCFDSVDHDILRRLVGEVVRDRADWTEFYEACREL